MIPVLVLTVEVAGIICLIIYSLADNDRWYASIFAAILSGVLSFLVGYQLLFGMVQSEVTPSLYYMDAQLGYTFIMTGVMIAVITFAITIDMVLKRRERKQ